MAACLAAAAVAAAAAAEAARGPAAWMEGTAALIELRPWRAPCRPSSVVPPGRRRAGAGA